MRSFTLEVWGALACFTRPEFKVERFSYPIITPSAARGIFDAIYLDFDPVGKSSLMYWQVSRIEVLEPVRYISLMRNEVKEKASLRSIQDWMKDPRRFTPLYADASGEESSGSKGRTQRQTMALKDVRYRLSAHAVLYRDDPALRQKIEQSFQRRARAGQCVYQPYLGCREFTGYFRLVEPDEPCPQPIPYNEKIGWMLYDVFDLSRPGRPLRTDKGEKPRISLFEAEVVAGVLEVPPYESEQVKKGGV